MIFKNTYNDTLAYNIDNENLVKLKIISQSFGIRAELISLQHYYRVQNMKCI